MNKNLAPDPDKIWNDIFEYIDTSNLTEDLKKKGCYKDRLLNLRNKKFSDVIDKNENQYVNLVQEGGGVLGISLVGFCFVLEFVGIRFLRLAGTSAGAINTLFMAAVGEKNEAKTPRLFEILRDLNLFDLADGHPFAKFMIKSLTSRDGIFKTLLITFVALIGLLIFIFPPLTFLSKLTLPFYIITFIGFLSLLFLALYMVFRFKAAKYGICKGDFFREKFLMKHLKNENINSKKELDHRAAQNYTLLDADLLNIQNQPYENKNSLQLYLRNSERHNNFKIISDYSFVTADIFNAEKVLFPKQAKKYWKNPELVNPADFVRASMSIPLFYKPFILEKGNEDKNIIQDGIFVDGGSISNFPIDLLHNPKINSPRLPIFGVRLVDEKPNDNKRINNFSDYSGNIINTMREHLDKDFLAKNDFYENSKSIADIKTFETEVGWLAFNMSDKQQQKLFIKGVETALDFLENFKWGFNYKPAREILASEMVKDL